MSFAVKAVNGGDYKNPSPGSVGAVCTRVVDMGTQETTWGEKRRVLLSFEIDERMDDGRPFLVSSSYTLSFHEKSALRQTLESWRGKKYAEGETFDLGKLVGQPALLNLVESDKGYVNIKSVSPLPKGMKALQAEGPTILFDFDDPDWDAFNDLSEKMQERLTNTPEFRGKDEKKKEPAEVTVTEASVADDFDDDIPF